MFQGFGTTFGCSSSALVSVLARRGNQSTYSTLTVGPLTSSPIHRSPPSKANLAIGEPSTAQPGGCQDLSGAVKSINNTESHGKSDVHLFKGQQFARGLQGNSESIPGFLRG